MTSLRVFKPGLFTTVQDGEREGLGYLGIPCGGGADSFSLRLGNRLVGNRDSAAAIEVTLTGCVVDVDGRCRVVVVGGDAPVTIWRANGGAESVGIGAAAELACGDRLGIGTLRTGARAYLCVAGGIDVPIVLGSRSTCQAGGFGGFEGRALRAGDRLEIAGAGGDAPPGTDIVRVREALRALVDAPSLRAVEGAHASMLGRGGEAFWAVEFTVSNRSDRTGVRLGGVTIDSGHDGRLPSEGMPPGAVQVPGGGEPIVLGVDHPTTGGYPCIACVIGADMPVVGQLRPGRRVRFERVTRPEALAFHHARERLLDRLAPRHEE